MDRAAGIAPLPWATQEWEEGRPLRFSGHRKASGPPPRHAHAGAMGEKHLVLLGGGHAHVEVLRHLGRRPLPGWRVTLLTREILSPYSGMLPGVIAGLYRPEEALLDTRRLAAATGATLVLDEAVGLDPAARLVRRMEGPPLPYGLLSIDTGARPGAADVPGAAEHALPLKPIDRLLPRFEALRAEIAQARERRLAVVGAGAAGTEVALALKARFGAAAKVSLIAGAAGLLPGFPQAFRRRAAAALQVRGITLHEGADVAEVSRGALRLKDGADLSVDHTLWATGAEAAPWLAETGLAQDGRGFLLTDARLRCAGHDRIFAAGDVAAFAPRPLPKAGVVAVRQGPVLAHNLRAAATGGRLGRYRPQRHWLVLLSLGDGDAIGTRNGVTVQGRWVWWWKDRLDRGFMRRYQNP